jgi:hypothetical protein
MISELNRLESLEIRSWWAVCKFLDEQSMTHLAAHCRNLRRLVLFKVNISLTSKSLSLLINRMKQLETLVLNLHSTSISLDIKQLASELRNRPQFRTMHIRGPKQMPFDFSIVPELSDRKFNVGPQETTIFHPMMNDF